jgi:hypothetical protein
MKSLTEALMPLTHSVTSDLAKLLAQSDAIDPAGRAVIGGAPVRASLPSFPSVNRCSGAEWHDCTTNPPDDEITVLLYDPSADERAWPGWREAGQWFWSDGSEAQPKSWRHFPDPTDPPGLHLLSARVHAFQLSRFPVQTLAGKINHLLKELEEVRDNPADIIEHADCLILLLGIASLNGHTGEQLLYAAAEKMAINEQREWHPPDADGICRHKE